MAEQEKLVYEFGPFCLEAAERRLLRQGQPVDLSPKDYGMLLLLVRNRGHLMGKDDLMKTLWPDSFVNETNLNKSISALRRVLGETPQAPQYIETVPKCGYRFIAPVLEVLPSERGLTVERYTTAETITEEEEEIIAGPADLESATTTGDGTPGASQPQAGEKRKRIRSMVAAALTLLSLVLLVSWLWIQLKRPEGRPQAIAGVSLTVLPFKTPGASGKGESAGQGMADALRARLSSLNGIAVRPTNTVLKYGNGQQGPTLAGRALQVDGVLEGTIQRVADRIRVTVRLLSVPQEALLWAGNFDEKFTDLLRTQDAIAEQVVTALALKLNDQQMPLLSRQFADDATANELYLRGRYLWNKRTWRGMQSASIYFKKAIERDPNFAPAYLGLADTYAMTIMPRETEKLINKALELDPLLGEAYASRGFIKMIHQWDWAGAEEDFLRATDLNPRYATTHQWYACYLALRGKLDEAKDSMRTALDLNPLSPNFTADLGQLYYFSRDYEQAIQQCQKALELDPQFYFGHNYLYFIYLKKGMYKEAMGALRNAEAVSSGHPAYVQDDSEVNMKTHEGFDTAEIRGFWQARIDHNKRRGAPAHYETAQFYCLLGEKEQALEYLQKAYVSHDFQMAFAGVDPLLDDLRQDPRYQSLLRRMGLAP